MKQAIAVLFAVLVLMLVILAGLRIMVEVTKAIAGVFGGG